MNELTVEQITVELSRALVGQRFGRIFVLSRLALAIDFRLPGSDFLFVSVEPAAPRVHLIRRRLRDIEKQSGNPSAFVLGLKKRLSNATVESVDKVASERAVVMRLRGFTELGTEESHSFVVQLTGRSANLFLLDGRGHVLDKLRETSGAGQDVGSVWAPPARASERAPREDKPFGRDGHETLSEALDEFYLVRDAERRFQERARAAKAKTAAELAKREKLLSRLRADLVGHGDAEAWKRKGDLILANLADAVMIDGKLLVVDYFDDNVPTIEIDIDENESLTENAERFFKRYTKARNARDEIARRSAEIEAELASLRARLAEIESAIEARDEDALDEFAGARVETPVRGARKKEPSFNGARRFVSSDGYEILVGKASKDNDQLTFKVAKSLDLWLHAADYPGSHVVVRNSSRGEIPQKTLLEAARLAAFYSHARQQPKVAVNYTPKKFVNKPKGAAPGLVSLSSFKTILVEPGIGDAVSA